MQWQLFFFRCTEWKTKYEQNFHYAKRTLRFFHVVYRSFWHRWTMINLHCNCVFSPARFFEYIFVQKVSSTTKPFAMTFHSIPKYIKQHIALVVKLYSLRCGLLNVFKSFFHFQFSGKYIKVCACYANCVMKPSSKVKIKHFASIFLFILGVSTSL